MIIRADQVRLNRNFVRTGDVVRVHGQRGDFVFRALATNTATGSTWAEVTGPLGGSKPKMRAFHIGEIRRTRRHEEARP